MVTHVNICLHKVNDIDVLIAWLPSGVSFERFWYVATALWALQTESEETEFQNLIYNSMNQPIVHPCPGKVPKWFQLLQYSKREKSIGKVF